MKRKKKRLVPVLCLAVLAVLAYARWVEPSLIRTDSYSVTAQLSVEPCRVVFFSDTHFGKYYSGEKASAVAKAVNACEPDIVIFGGDLLDNYARDKNELDLDLICEAFASIEAPGGKFAVWGNHDYGGGASRIYEDVMAAGGFQVLNDESVLLEQYGVRVVGYDDTLMGWTDPSLYELHSGEFLIVAAHEPEVSLQLSGAEDALVLSGHTHGGQVNLPVLTERLLPPGSGPFRKGFYPAGSKEGQQYSTYVTSGLGTTQIPLRFLAVPEIVEITIVPDAQNA